MQPVVHADSQQTPSAQKLLAQSDAMVHAAPFAAAGASLPPSTGASPPPSIHACVGLRRRPPRRRSRAPAGACRSRRARGTCRAAAAPAPPPPPPPTLPARPPFLPRRWLRPRRLRPPHPPRRLAAAAAGRARRPCHSAAARRAACATPARRATRRRRSIHSAVGWRTTVCTASRQPEDGGEGQNPNTTRKRGTIRHGCHCLPPQRRQLPAFAIHCETICCFLLTTEQCIENAYMRWFRNVFVIEQQWSRNRARLSITPRVFVRDAPNGHRLAAGCATHAATMS